MADQLKIDSAALRAALQQAAHTAVAEAMALRLLTKEEVCERLHCRATKLRMLPELRPIRLGHHVRYLAGDVQAYIRALTAERDGGSTQGPGRPRSTDAHQ